MKERSSCLQLIVSHSFWRQLPYGEHVCFHADTGVKKGESSVMLNDLNASTLQFLRRTVIFPGGLTLSQQKPSPKVTLLRTQQASRWDPQFSVDCLELL